LVKEASNGWSVNAAAYEFNGSITFDSADIPFDQVGSIGAFVGDECRGIGEVKVFPYSGQSVVLMMVYSNVADGEVITIKAEHSSTGEVYYINEKINFMSDMIKGSALEPVMMTKKLLN